MLTVVLVALAAAAPPPEYAWAEFSADTVLIGHVQTVLVGSLGWRDRGQYDYWLRKTEVKAGRTTVVWTDTRRCPAAREVVVSMAQVPLPQPKVPGLEYPPPPPHLVMDGTAYRLRMPAYHASGDEDEVRMTTNVGSPLAAWVDSALARLGPCWSTTSPE